MSRTRCLREEFEARLARLKDENATLRHRLADRDTTITTLAGFREQALARLAAQHEITGFRQQAGGIAKVRRLPTRTAGTGPCS